MQQNIDQANKLQAQYIYYWQQMQIAQYYSSLGLTIPLPQMPIINQPSQTKKKKKTRAERKAKKAQKMQQIKKQFQENRSKYGQWAKKPAELLAFQQSQKEKIQSKAVKKEKDPLSHLKRISKQVYVMKQKLGLLKRQTQKQKTIRILQQQYKVRCRKKKKPTRIKLSFQRYRARIKPAITTVQNNQPEWEDVQQQTQAPPQEVKKINYPVSKLQNFKFQSRTLRPWVNHIPSKQLQDKVLILVNRLAYLQAIKKIKQPLKAKKRIVSGLNQVSRTVFTINQKAKSKMLIFALNINKNDESDGYDSRILQILSHAESQGIPTIHSSNRRNLGRAMIGKFGPKVSVISILNAQSCQESMQQIRLLWIRLSQLYRMI